MIFYCTILELGQRFNNFFYIQTYNLQHVQTQIAETVMDVRRIGFIGSLFCHVSHPTYISFWLLGLCEPLDLIT